MVEEKPSSLAGIPCDGYYGGESEPWVCIFPGKMGISWKLAWGAVYGLSGTREEAQAQAAKNRNVVAVPLALWLRYKEYEHRTVAAENKLLGELGLRVDYINSQPVFVRVGLPKTDESAS